MLASRWCAAAATAAAHTGRTCALGALSSVISSPNNLATCTIASVGTSSPARICAFVCAWQATRELTGLCHTLGEPQAWLQDRAEALTASTNCMSSWAEPCASRDAISVAMVFTCFHKTTKTHALTRA